jgi:hypothetical protein
VKCGTDSGQSPNALVVGPRIEPPGIVVRDRESDDPDSFARIGMTL